VTIGGLFSVSLLCLFSEIVFARFIRKSVGLTQELNGSSEMHKIHYEFSLKLAFQNDDVLKEYVHRMKQHHMNLCAEFQGSINEASF
jgi:hypothetical protein